MRELMRKIKSLYGKSHILTYTFLILFGIIMFVPFYMLIGTSLGFYRNIGSSPLRLFPTSVRWFSVLRFFQNSEMLATFGRTFLLSFTTAAITTLTSAMAGFAFARVKGPGEKQLFATILLLMMIPYIVIEIPQFILYANLFNIINTYWPWYLMAIGGTPLYIFMCSQFFKSFPKALEEAAEMDGANPLQIFIRLILPNSKPVLATVFIFAFCYIWGDYIMPTMFLNDPSKLLGTMMAGGGGRFSGSFATLMYILPPAILFLFVQKNMQKGFLFTGLHG